MLAGATTDSRALAVGLNLMYLVEGSGGAGRYAHELIPALLRRAPSPRITAFVNRDVPEQLIAEPWASDVEWVRLPVSTRRKAHLVAQVTAIPALAARRRLEVLHSLANGGPLVTPGVARVVTLLDLIWLHQREAWDRAGAVRSMQLLTRASARAAHRVIAISESARDDIVSNFAVDADKIDVTPLGVRAPSSGIVSVSERELRERFELGTAPIVLCVAQKRPYKNLSRLIEALPSLVEEGPVLVLTGPPTEHEHELRELARSLRVEPRVRFVAWMSEGELDALYRAASCFVLPSLIEGFGLPVLEAMARDVPVACSNRPALPEVAGDAALYFEPENQDAITEAIRRLLHDRALADSLVVRGRERVALYTWDRTAETTLTSYQLAIADRSRQSRLSRLRGRAHSSSESHGPSSPN